MSNDPIHRYPLPNLGESTGLDANSVSQYFTDLYLGIPYDIHCVICGQSPQYKLIAKPTSGFVIPDKDSYACKHCLPKLDPSQIGIRPLDRHTIIPEL